MGDVGDLSPELRLLAACLRWPPSPDRAAAVTAAAADPRLDWTLFASAIDRHRVSAFVHDGLTRAGVASAPAAFATALARRAAADGLLNLVFVREAERLVAALRAEGIDVLVLKGAGLMMQVYGDLAVRQSRDLDLLVSPRDAVRAGAICEAAGYVRGSPPPGTSGVQMDQWLRWRKDFIYQRDGASLVLELHFRPVVNPLLAPGLDLQEGRREVALPGGRTLPAPAGPALYAYLCLHGALCAWFRMKWLADIMALTATLSDAEVTALHEAAVARGAGRASGQALLLAEAVFGRPLPPGLGATLRRDPRVRWLARFAFRVMTDPREPERVPLRSSAIHLSHLLLAGTWRARWREVQDWLIDWPLVFALPLPRSLWVVYPLLRGPAWLARKLGWRG